MRTKIDNHLLSIFGNPSLYCDPGDQDWQALTWGRYGAGGVVDARHLFVDDWRIEHLWRRSGEGLAKAICAGIVTAPDYTLDLCYPIELAQYQVWRSAVLGAYWSAHGVRVVPVLQWAGPKTWGLAAKYISPGSVVAVRGPAANEEERQRWLIGARAVFNAVKPGLVLHFGRSVIDFWPDVHFFPLRQSKSSS